MNRLEFMKELELLLNDISPSEREEAMQYYNDYLNDAGVENEQEVLDSLGTPAQLAKIIREGLGDGSQAGEFTENGYRNETYEMPKQHEVMETGSKGKNKKQPMSGGMVVLIVLLCLIASPFLIGIVSGVIGAGFGILGGIFGLLVGTAAAAVTLFAVGIAMLALGIGEMMATPLVGMCFIGAGILILGLAMFFLWLTVWLWGTAVPWLIRKVVNLISRLVHKKGGAAA